MRNGPEIRCGAKRNPDALAKKRLKHLFQITHQRIEANQARLQHLPAAEGQQLPGQCSCPVRGPENLLDRPARLCILGMLLQKDLTIAGNDGQQVVEVVCDTTRQRTNRLHFLGLP